MNSDIDSFFANVTNIQRSVYDPGQNIDNKTYVDFIYRYEKPFMKYTLSLTLFSLDELKLFVDFFLSANESFYCYFLHSDVFLYTSVLSIQYITKGVFSLSIELRDCLEIDNNDVKIYRLADNSVAGFIKSDRNVMGSIITAYYDSVFFYVYYNHTEYKYASYQYFYYIDGLYIHLDEQLFASQTYENLWENKNNFLYIKEEPRIIESVEGGVVYRYFYYSETPLLIETSNSIKNIIYDSLNDKKIHEYYINESIHNSDEESLLFHNFLLSGNDFFLSEGNTVNFLPSNFVFHIIYGATIATSYIPSISTNAQRYYYTCGMYNFEGGKNRIFSIYYGYGERFNNQYGYENTLNFVITNAETEERQIITRVKTDYTYIPGLGILATPNFSYPVAYQFCSLFDITTVFLYIYYYYGTEYENSIAPLLLCIFDIKINNTAFIFFPCYNLELSKYILYIERYDVVNGELRFNSCDPLELTEFFMFDNFYFRTNYFNLVVLFNVLFENELRYNFNEVNSWDTAVQHFDAQLKNYRIFLP